MKHLRFVNPDYVRQLPDGVMMGELEEALKNFRSVSLAVVDFLDIHHPVLSDLRSEFPALRKACKFVDLSKCLDDKEKSLRIGEFWRLHRKTRLFPSWVLLADLSFLIQPSSCSAERGFSVLKRILRTNSQKQNVSQAGLMLSYNKPRVIESADAYRARLLSNCPDIVEEEDWSDDDEEYDEEQLQE